MPFVKGQSGNPSGRPKEDAEVKALARQHTEDAITALVHWIKQRDNPKASVSAAIAILERGYGKPAQTISGDKDNPLINKILVEIVRS